MKLACNGSFHGSRERLRLNGEEGEGASLSRCPMSQLLAIAAEEFKFRCRAAA